MTPEQKIHWEAKVRSSWSMILEGSNNRDFLLYCAVDKELKRLQKEIESLKDKKEI